MNLLKAWADSFYIYGLLATSNPVGFGAGFGAACRLCFGT